MADRSTQMYQDYKAGSRQFDYFVTGLAAAMFAYGIQHYVPRRFTISVTLVEPASLLALLLSVYYGLTRLQSQVEADRQNFVVLDASERQAKAANAYGSSGTSALLNTETGQYHTRDELKALEGAQAARRGRAQTELEKIKKADHRYYRLRNQLLGAGFALMIMQKLVLPYLS